MKTSTTRLNSYAIVGRVPVKTGSKDTFRIQSRIGRIALSRWPEYVTVLKQDTLRQFSIELVRELIRYGSGTFSITHIQEVIEDDVVITFEAKIKQDDDIANENKNR